MFGLASATLLFAACGGDDDDADPTSTATAASTTTSTATVTRTATVTATGTATGTAAAGETVEVTAVDYEFEDLPESVDAGTQLTLTNASTAELHELVALLIPASETRPVSELVELPEEEIMTIFAGEPAAVLIAPPGEDGMAVVGDGTLTDTGRYAIICSIPTGADPQAFLDAMESGAEEPPEVEGGPPHFVNGMFAELTVE